MEIVGVPIAHAVVEAPDVREAFVEEVRDEVPVLWHDEHVGRAGEPVDEQDDVFAGLSPPKAEEAEAKPVVGRHVVRRDLRVRNPVEGVPCDLAHARTAAVSAMIAALEAVDPPEPADEEADEGSEPGDSPTDRLAPRAKAHALA